MSEGKKINITCNCMDCDHFNVCSYIDEVKRINELAQKHFTTDSPYIGLNISCKQFKKPGYR